MWQSKLNVFNPKSNEFRANQFPQCQIVGICYQNRQKSVSNSDLHSICRLMWYLIEVTKWAHKAWNCMIEHKSQKRKLLTSLVKPCAFYSVANGHIYSILCVVAFSGFALEASNFESALYTLRSNHRINWIWVMILSNIFTFCYYSLYVIRNSIWQKGYWKEQSGNKMLEVFSSIS